MRERDIFEG